MSTLYIVLTIALVFTSIAIIVLVLLQKGKGADAGAAFGSGASGTVFGSRGTGSFLSRATAVLATLFFANCLALAYLSGQRSGPESLLQEGTELSEESRVELEPADSLENVLPAPESADEPADEPPDAGDLDELPALDGSTGEPSEP